MNARSRNLFLIITAAVGMVALWAVGVLAATSLASLVGTSSTMVTGLTAHRPSVAASAPSRPEPTASPRARAAVAGLTDAPTLVTTTPVTTTTAAAPPPPKSEWAVAMPVPRCPGELRLVASLVDVGHPERSLAAVRMSGGTRLLRASETLASLRLTSIDSSHAYFQQADGSRCGLPVFLPGGERTPSSAAPRAAPPPVAAKAPAALDLTQLRAGIRKTGPNSYTVSHEALSKALGNLMALRRGGRFKLRSENGRVSGLELVRVKDNSPLTWLGMQRGDVVRNLNGHDLAAPDGALQALQTLRTQQRFSLSLVRNGAPQSIAFSVE